MEKGFFFQPYSAKTHGMELLIILGLTLLNGLFALSEMALVSSKKPRLKALADNGDRGAAAALKLLEDPSSFLSAIQIGITSIGIVAGAFGASALSADVAPLIKEAIPALSDNADEIAFIMVIVLTTYLSLVLGELLPKRVALAAPEKLAALVAPGMGLLAIVGAPLVWFLKLSTELLLRILGLANVKAQEVTEEEVRSMIEEGHAAGVLESREREMIEGVMMMADRGVRSIMTPRHQVVWLDPDAPRADTLTRIAQSGHSRFPVAKGSLDGLVGIIQAKDFVVRDNGVDLGAAAHPPLVIHEGLSVMRLLEQMRDRPVRMAIVVDEHGEIQGIVTAADILGAIAGDDVALSSGEAVSSPVQRDDGTWLVDGMMRIETFAQHFELVRAPEAGDAETVAGLVVHCLQRVPKVGDSVEIGLLHIEVIDMDRMRIDKILVTQR